MVISLSSNCALSIVFCIKPAIFEQELCPNSSVVFSEWHFLGWFCTSKHIIFLSWGTGTSLESFSASTFHDLYKTTLQPFIDAHLDLFKSSLTEFSSLLQMACLVQSRAFHMEANNWVTNTVSKHIEFYDSSFVLVGIIMRPVITPASVTPLVAQGNKVLRLMLHPPRRSIHWFARGFETAINKCCNTSG